jgi:ABC-2 type transport system ATP-binding protein
MSTPAIATVNLSKRYGQRAAVDNLALEVEEGAIFGFLGPNGSGKTTTIRLLLSLIRPTGGDAFLFGHSIKRQYPRYLDQVGALVDEADFYLNLSALTNLKLLARLHQGVDEARCLEVLKIVGLLDRAHDRVKTYSHGMCQRLGIAQAILHRPRLLILDEPTTGLDPQGMHDVAGSWSLVRSPISFLLKLPHSPSSRPTPWKRRETSWKTFPMSPTSSPMVGICVSV